MTTESGAGPVNPRMRLAAALLAGVGAAGAPRSLPAGPTADCGAERGSEWVRAVVVTRGEEDPSVALGIRSFGGNTMVTFARPSAAAAAAARAAGIAYVAFVSTQDVDRLRSEPLLAEQIRAIPHLSGFYFDDEEAVEGYATPEAQERTYATLKALFPTALVLHPTRLDPIATDSGYLDGFFRPTFTDLVAPYFYPVGTTILGAQTEADPWETRLRSLLAPLAARVPRGKGVLPVLQAFEQEGYPVTGRLGVRQRNVYETFWPDNGNLAAFSWAGADDGPFRGLSQQPLLFDGFRRLLGGALVRPAPCLVPSRGR